MTTSNGFLGRDGFFAASARRFKEVALPDGNKARIRSLTAGEWAGIDSRNVDMKKGGINPTGLRNSDLRLIVASVVDGEGNPIFTDADVPKLGTIDAAVTITLTRAIKEHSGIRQDTEDAQK